MKKVCLITPGHISTNPRLVKEAMALSQSGYKVHIIFTQYVDRQIGFDEQILRDNPEWGYDKLDWTGSSICSKLHRLTGKILSSLLSNPILKTNRNLYWQRSKACKANADLYIAHNLGALPIAVYVAKKVKAKCGFDAEDLHRNETTDDTGNETVKLTIAIEDEYIPHLDQLTASSQLIADRYSLFYDIKANTVLNVFPKTSYSFKNEEPYGALQLFWFSQTIGPNRGLEQVIKAINVSEIKVHLHLLGQPSPGFIKTLTDSADAQYCQVILHNTMAPDDIFKLANHFDIGLAAEPKTPLNRDICLTNKLFTYIQSGLAVLASNTTAQRDFISEHHQIGELYTNEEELAALLIAYDNDRAKLSNAKAACLDLGNSILNWEAESKKFIEVVKETLQH